MYQYDEKFYRYINQGAQISAKSILPIVEQALSMQVKSVLDAGCGEGAWLSVWKSMGANVVGLDGAYVNAQQLLIDEAEFVATDLSRGFDLQQRFELAQSLEVAEHLPEASADGLVNSLCKHADIVLFSAAPPGQGGENHINEKPYCYWRDIFAANGYRMYDVIRPAVLTDRNIKPWYRYNTFLYVNENVAPDLHRTLADNRVAAEGPVPDLSPYAYQLRKRVVSLLPAGMSTLLARIKGAVNRLWGRIKNQ